MVCVDVWIFIKLNRREKDIAVRTDTLEVLLGALEDLGATT